MPLFRTQTYTCTLLQEMSFDACQQMTYDPYTYVKYLKNLRSLFFGQVLHTPCPEFCRRHMPMQYTMTQSISAYFSQYSSIKRRQ